MPIYSNFFIVPHSFEGSIGNTLSPSEKYFLITLFKLENRYAIEEGEWFWHKDKEFSDINGERLGFESYGFSHPTCHRFRKKLVRCGFIETRKQISRSGFVSGISYRILHSRFINHPPIQNEHREPHHQFPSAQNEPREPSP